MAKEKATLLKLQSEVTSFKGNLLELYKRHLDMIAVIPEFENENNTELETKAEDILAPVETVIPEAPAVEEITEGAEKTVETAAKENDDSIFNGLVFDSEENN